MPRRTQFRSIVTASPPSTATTQKRILFVDDDAEFLQMMDRVMRLWSNNSLEILTAQSASAALALLQEQSPDLIVMDVCMPVIDGLQFLAMVHRRYPGVPKVVLTGNPEDTYRKACLENGAELFLEKPRTSEGFEAIFSTLDELTRWKPEAGFRGMLRSVGLTDVLQMECIARSSSILTVTSPELSGAIYIRDGTIIHAETAGLKGEDAFKRLIALVSGDFRSHPFADPPEESIQAPWESLLMDAAQARDEFLGAQAAEKISAPEDLPILESQPAIPQAAESCPPIDIDELLICSAAGDVYHAWQCENTELRINLVEFLAQKSRLLQNALPFGTFDRAEFIASGSRLVAQLEGDSGVIVRSSLGGSATAKNDPLPGSGRVQSNPQLRAKATAFFEQRLDLPGLFAAALQFPDRTALSLSRASHFTPEAIELLRRAAADGFQVLKFQRFHAQRARWIFEQNAIECAQWPDGTFLALVFSRRALDLNTALVERCLRAFLNQE